MVGSYYSSVLNQPQQFMISHEHCIQIPETDFTFKEQEFISLVKKCKNVKELKQVHGQILKLGFHCSSFCASNLLATCAIQEWGSMDYASSIFRKMDDPGSFDFNVMIRGHNKEMNFVQALFKYIEMLDSEIEPNNFTFPAVLKACAALATINSGNQIHGQILKLGLVEDLFVQNSLINMYGKCGELSRSCEIFARMDEKSIASWSALISAHANSGNWGECLWLFCEMNTEGIWRAEESTLVSVLSACAHLGALDLGRSVHGYLSRNLMGLNVAVETCLIDMYIKCGSLEKGMCLFRNMSNKNEKSYSVVISGLASHGRGEEALSVFDQMVKEGLKPDEVVYIGVLSACSRIGLVEKGLELFERMRYQDQIEPSIQHYGCLVYLMGRAGKINEAFEFIKNIPVNPNDVIWRSLLSACKVHQNVEMGEIVMENLFLLNTKKPCDYLMMSDLYAQEQRWPDVKIIRTKMAREVLDETTGSCSVEVKRKVYKFVSNDTTHPKCREIHEMIRQMEWQLKFEGYCPDTSQVLFDVDEEEKRERLSYHSQKLAMAFSMISTSHGSPIRIARNVRMCSDCHTYTKLISSIYEREIMVRDRNMFHHFRDGNCTCKDYW